MTLNLSKNRIKKLNDAIFWRCYALDRKLQQLFSRRTELLAPAAFSRVMLIFALMVAAAVPQVVSSEQDEVTDDIAGESVQEFNESVLILDLPESPDRPVSSYRVSVTFYSSDPWQTDDTPFITANGTYVHDGIVATNALPFGTVVRLPEIYGDKLFTVEDRMNKRYPTRVDVWVQHRDEAFARGIVRNSLLEVYE